MDQRSSWQIQKAVFHALFVREIQTRFGRFRLGFIWALIEPLSHIIVLSALFSTIRERNAFFDVPFPVFFATGVLSFFLFQKTVMSSLASIRVNEGLFGYRQVKPIDAVFVRAVLEIMVNLSCMLLLGIAGFWIFDYQLVPVRPLGLVSVIAVLCLFGLAVGLMVSVLSALSEELGKFVPTIMRPLYFLSGIFYPLDAIPQQYHVYLLWNPLLHGVEQFRAAFISGYPAENTSLYYVFFCAILSMFLGLLIYFINSERVLTK